MSPRFLILTASFGEGHNSAAKNLALALQQRGIESQVLDPFLKSTPRLMPIVMSCYQLLITYAPKIWAIAYQACNHTDFSISPPWLWKMEAFLKQHIESYQPTEIICTFPLFPHVLERLFNKTGLKLRVHSIITDSIEINNAWRSSAVDHYYVTDPVTRDAMVKNHYVFDKIHVTGFPVNPCFATMLDKPTPTHSPAAFRVLYFPTGQKSHIQSRGRATLNASPDISLTIVLGKNTKKFLKAALLLKNEFPSRVKLIGWTRRIPQLLHSHHLVIGKAGGATVHEAIAAHTPMLIHHLVPGQEEGNLKLLVQLGAGALADSPQKITDALESILLHDKARWKLMRSALISHQKCDGAIAITQLILSSRDLPL